MRTDPSKEPQIDNAIYNTLGERWYTAFDDPVALLRAECRLKHKWIENQLNERFTIHKRPLKILDLGCGGGFLSNAMALNRHNVTGVDLSDSSLEIAKKYDSTGTVEYLRADVTRLPFEPQSFDVVTALDLLEHVQEPENVVKEAARVLRPGGLFFFHTFNRNWMTRWIVIKGVEWLVKNTPRHLHVHHLFIKPKEMEHFLKKSGFSDISWTGIRPKLASITWQGLRTRTVPEKFAFTMCRSLKLSYMGAAQLDTSGQYARQGSLRDNDHEHA